MELSSGSVGYLITIQALHLPMERKGKTTGTTNAGGTVAVRTEASQAADEPRGFDYTQWQAGVLAFLSLAIAASVVEIGVWRQSVNLSLVVPEIRKIDETPASLKGENVVRADLNPFIRIITWEFFLGGVAGVDGICWWAVL